MSARSSIRALIVIAVAIVAASVWLLGQAQRDGVTASFRQSEVAHQMLTARLDEETGLRGYLNTRRPEFLEPFVDGKRRFARVLGEARRLTPASDRTAHKMIDRSEDLASRWRVRADEAVVEVRLGRERPSPVDDALARKALMDSFRVTQARLVAHLERRRSAELDRMGTLSVVLILGLGTLFAVGGWVGLWRPAEQRARRERQQSRQRERQVRFAQALQFADSEEDAHALLKRHLERNIPAADIVVLQRNNSADRLEAVTDVAGNQAFETALSVAQPRSCLAVRLGAAYEGGDADQLMACELCGKAARELATCTPLLVQGEVIGSVLVSHDEALDEAARQYVTETVTQAAPVVANMRNLAIAELRAATDALTGLANRRSIQDTLRRMVAQANRSGTALSAVALDLDHFKKINDRFGHDKGDDVLAATAQVLTSTLRTSDFVGRQGGEEFIVLLPDTDREGALVAAENLRAAIEQIEIPGVDRAITASLGVAVYPADALDADALLRHADRALYMAKERGRNCVEVATPGSAQSAALI